MKNTILAITLLLGFGLTANAQDEMKRHKPDAKKMTERMKAQLELTEEQVELVYMANEDMIKMMEEAGGREADRAKVDLIRKEHLTKLNEILTPKQMEKFKSDNKKRVVRRKAKRSDHRDQ